ncbi:zinc finger protein 737 [Manduca sexta]|uniref:C2H2-type domain-containing protein n=1 Tax=Manduca sexta TaxID=7130 RepID=A0A921ZE37_MANSE|nr:zinc finger protein 737 [Manduca sexta]KAG6455860.1 hypothetical protein O3G_MSEX009412 [Manduca sexta]
MDISQVLFIKQEKVEDSESLFDLGFDIKIKVENASPEGAEEMDWCVDNRDMFDGYVNEYDELLECSKQECALCHEKFDDLYSLYQHNISHIRVPLSSCLHNSYQCEPCNVYFETKDKLDAHKALCNHQTKKEYQCFECGKTMSYKSWHSHKLTVHKSDKATCAICKKKFKCHQYLRRHMKYVHNGDRPCWKINSDVKCQLCPTILRNKHALKTHMNNCHSDSEFTCGVCQAVFKSKPYLRTHIARVHDGDGKKYKCVCGKNFSSSRRLRRHKQRSGC